MPNTANIVFTETDASFSVVGLLKGISCVEGETKRGAFSKQKLITSTDDFQRQMGGLIPNSDFPLLCRRALERGALLRISRVGHYTDITNKTTLTAIKPSAITFKNATPSNLFKLRPKDEGTDGNNIAVEIKAASNGNVDFFDLLITHSVESALNETYKNLFIEGHPTIGQSTYLNTLKTQSRLIDVEYLDLSALTGQLRPVNITSQFSGGSDGDPVVASDFVGDATANTGFHAFDGVDDALQIAAPEISDNAVHIAGAAYVEGRRDMLYLAHLDNSNSTKDQLITARQATGINSSYVGFYAGGLKILDPIIGVEKEISELGDIIGIISSSDKNFGEWFSYAGPNRGRIFNALGIVNNFGSPGKFNDLNILANSQINMVVVKDNVPQLSGNFTGQLANSKLSFVNIRRFLLFLKKSLRPSLAIFIEEPNDVQTFKAIFRIVKPFLDSLVAKRALFSYRWQGDQDISRIEDVVINNKTDLDNGKYKVRLFVKITPTMQEIEINIIITPTSVNFEELE